MSAHKTDALPAMGERSGRPDTPSAVLSRSSVGSAKRVSGAASRYASCEPGWAASGRVTAATCASITSSSWVYAQRINGKGSAADGAGHGSDDQRSRLTMFVKRSETKLVLVAVRAADSSTSSPSNFDSPYVSIGIAPCSSSTGR